MTPPVRFGINFIQDAPLPEVIPWWQSAEAMGFEWVGIPDSPLLVRELYVCCTAFALNTTRARFSPMVSNPISRHPSVTAASLFSLEELAPGRVALIIGAGDSAIYGVGLVGARVEAMVDYVRCVKGLLRGEAVTWQGRSFHPEWRHWSPPVEVPVYVACHGPKIMRAAAGVADGILTQFGFLPENLALERQLIEEGARAAGRDPDEVDVWHHVPVAAADTVEEAFVHSSAGGAHFHARGGFAGKQIPEEYQEAIAALAAEERLETHGRENRQLLDMAEASGVKDYLIARAGGLIGPPSTFRQRVEELVERGVNKMIFLPLGNDKMGVTRALVDAVVTPLQGAPA
jgi:5,10-methylenetetrahydromethanopterin reductase